MLRASKPRRSRLRGLHARRRHGGATVRAAARASSSQLALRRRGRPRCSSAPATCRCRPTSARARTQADRERYQTVYARDAGRGRRAHRRAALRRRRCSRALRARGVDIASVTLHVGAGTFQPVRGERRRRAPHAQRALRRAAGRGDAIARRARARRARGRGRARRRCARSRAPRRDDGTAARRTGETATVHHPRATASAWSTGCSPTSTCRARRC